MDVRYVLFVLATITYKSFGCQVVFTKPDLQKPLTKTEGSSVWSGSASRARIRPRCRLFGFTFGSSLVFGLVPATAGETVVRSIVWAERFFVVWFSAHYLFSRQ